MEHTFVPADAGDLECRTCGMPRSNRRHVIEQAPAPTVVEHAVAALTSAAVQEALDAAPASLTAARGARLKAGSTRVAVLDAIVAAEPHGGATDAELFARLDRYGPNTLRPRRTELVSAGLIRAARDEQGHVRYRDGSTVWVPTPAGLAALRQAV